MKCPKCGKETRMIRSYSAGAGAKTIERRCEEGHAHVYAVQLVGEVDERGTGAYAVASRLKSEAEEPAPESNDEEEQED